MPNELDTLVATYKTALTDARKRGPMAVIAVCDAATAEWERVGYPDCWADWDRARYDAELTLTMRCGS
jgi:hypothetical protein